MNQPAISSPIALILAGGSGERLGRVRKHDLRLGNRTLSAHLYDRLQNQSRAILLSAPGQIEPAANFAAVLPDSSDGPRGPAAGLLAGARWIIENRQEAVMLTAPVDAPLFPLDFSARALPLLENGVSCVMAAYGNSLYPTACLWRPEPLLAWLSALPAASRGPSLRSIARDLGARRLDFSAFEPQDPFAGINTVAELVALTKRLGNRSGHAD